MKTFILPGLALLAAQAAPPATPPAEAPPPPQPNAAPRAAAQAVQLTTDTAYDAKVAQPAYRDRHPIVLFDEAHRNFHTPETRYKPFADLIASDGYRIVPNQQPFSAASLAGHDILVIANALGTRGVEAYWTSPFTPEECAAVRDWVKGGGSLLLIADHMPFGAAAEPLAKVFGVDMSKGYTTDLKMADPILNGTNIIYTRDNHGLGRHPILDGRNAGERIARVETFTGQSLKGGEDSVSLLQLGDDAIDNLPPTPEEIQAAVARAREEATRAGKPSPGGVPMRLSGHQSAAGRSQGLAFRYGKGRVVILGEAAMLSAQLGPNGEKLGMNRPGLDNRQLALNVMHWLSGLLN